MPFGLLHEMRILSHLFMRWKGSVDVIDLNQRFCREFVHE